MRIHTRPRFAYFTVIILHWGIIGRADDVIPLEAPGDISLVADDLNVDGRPDLVAIHREGEFVEVFLSRGPGTFVLTDRYDVERDSAPLYGAAGLIDHEDTLTDIVTFRGDVGGSNGVFTVGLGNGKGRFSPTFGLFDVGGTAVAIGDFDRDTFLDRAQADASGEVEIFYLFGGDPGTGVGLSSGIEDPRVIVSADLNGDGLQDFVVWGTSSAPSLSIIQAVGTRGYGVPALLERTPDPAGQPIRGVACDFNKDGHEEVILYSSNVVDNTLYSNLFLLEQPNEELVFRRMGPSLRLRNRFSANLQIVDLDGDDSVEMLVQSVDNQNRDGIRVLQVLPENGIAFIERCFVPFFGDTTFFTTADFDNNGLEDLATALRQDGAVSISSAIMKNGCEPTKVCFLSTAHAGSGPVQAAAVVPGLTPAVVACARAGQIDLTAFGKEGASVVSVIAGPNATGGLAFAGSSGGSPLEMFLTNAETGMLELQSLSELGPVGNRRKWPLGSLPAALALADWDADGQLDVAVALPNGGQVAVLLRGGGDELLPQEHFAAGNAPTQLAVGDIDQDGRPDLVATNAGTSRIAVLRGVPEGKLTPPILPRVVFDPRDAVIADLGANGTADIAVVSAGTNALAILEVRGDAFVPQFYALPSGTLPTAVLSVDLDDDSRPDLQVAAAGANSTLLFQGTSVGVDDSWTVADRSLRMVRGGDALLFALELDSNGWSDLLQIERMTGRSIGYLALGCGGSANFRRGDSDFDGVVKISDAIRVLGFLYSGGELLTCLDAADVDDNGRVNISDAIFLLQYLFVGGSEPASPGAERCGPDANLDGFDTCAGTCI